jgi:hypothetical protein
MKNSRFNSFLTGLILGVFIQLVSFYVLLMLHKSIAGYTERPVSDFFSGLMDYDAGRRQIIPKLLALAAISELLLFFVFIWTDKLKSARGVIGSAFILGIVIAILKFF